MRSQARRAEDHRSGPARDASRRLPPGQRRVEGFPRFGTHLHRPPPPIPEHPTIEVTGAVAEPVTVPVADLARLPRREMTADFHCVSGWSATDLRWEGVPYAEFHRTVVEPALPPGTTVTHVVFEGLDRYRSIVALDDALADGVLLADRLDGRPLDTDHGAPVRLVSPDQYAFVSTKHLCRVEVRTAEPQEPYRYGPAFARAMLRTPLIRPHPAANVWREERHAYLPARVLRPLYRLVIAPGIALCARGSREGRARRH